MGFWLEYFASAPEGLGGLGSAEDVLLMDPAAANWILSEEDVEDLRDGLEPLELPKKRLVLVPLADRKVGDEVEVLEPERRSELKIMCF